MGPSGVIYDCKYADLCCFPPIKAECAFPILGSNGTETAENGTADRFDQENEQIVIMTGHNRLHSQYDVAAFEERFKRIASLIHGFGSGVQTISMQNFRIANQVGLIAAGDEPDLTRRQ